MLIRSSFMILSFIITILLIAHLKNSLPDVKTIILILLFGCIIFPIGLTSFSLIIWTFVQTKKKRVFESLDLNKIGFVYKEINEERFWKLNENIITKKVDNYVINANLSETHANQLEIQIQLEWRKIDKNEFEVLESEFKSQNIELNIGCIVKRFSIKTLLAKKDSTQFKKDILDFITLTKQKGFAPKL